MAVKILLTAIFSVIYIVYGSAHFVAIKIKNKESLATLSHSSGTVYS